METLNIEHIGTAVKNIDESIAFYEKILGLKCYAVEEVKEQKAKTAFFWLGQTKIKLLESTEPHGPIGKFIEKKEKVYTILQLKLRTSILLCRRLNLKAYNLLTNLTAMVSKGLKLPFFIQNQLLIYYLNSVKIIIN